MCIKKIALGVVLGLATSAAMADGFNGIDGSAALAIQNYNYGGGSQTNNGASLETFSAVNKTAPNGSFSIGYNFKMSQKFLIGIQTLFQPISTSNADAQKVPGTMTSNNIDLRVDVSVLPGMMVTDNTMLYGKVGYSYAKRDMADADGSWSDDLNYSGVVVGLGVKSLALGKLMGNLPLYAFAEVNYAYYGSEKYSVMNTFGHSVDSTNLGLSSTTGLVGVGYIF